MSDRQKKKRYKQQHGYNPAEEAQIQQLISETIRYTEQRLEQDEKDRLNRTYAGFLKSIKQRPRSKHWWRRGKC